MTANENYLLKLLSDNNVTFYIPPYQRNYEWTKEECEIFYQDILNTEIKNINDEQSEHFFSSFTYFGVNTVFGQPNKLVLIDGQQRLTTTMLFLIAARNTITDIVKKNTIEDMYLKNNRVKGGDELKIKLKQVANDATVFRKIVLNEPLVAEEKETQVYKNYYYFFSKLENMDEKKVYSLIENGLNHFSIVTIEIQPEKPWENPQEIFESMNSLGKPLSFADLVRNYLLMGLDTDEQERYYEHYWLLIEKLVKNNISDFIRDYMQAKCKKPFKKASDINSKELYGEFKIFSAAHVGNIEPFFKEMCSYAECYSIVLQINSSENERIDELLSWFNCIKATPTRTPLLEIIYQYKNKIITADDVIDIVEPIFVHIMRRKFLGINAGENKKYPLLVKDILDIIYESDKRSKTYEMLGKQEFSFRMPNNNELRSYLLTADLYHTETCNFVLALIEKKLTKHMPDLKDKKLQIEHILPQKLTKEWEDELGGNAVDIHGALVNTIGNLTLIRHNQELSTKSFKDKKDIYINNSGLQIAKTKIINHDHWRELEIKARTEFLVNMLIDEIFPVPDSMKTGNNYRIDSKRYNFREMGLIGEYITYIDDPTKKFKIVNDAEVEYNGNPIRLSPLTKELKTLTGDVSPSGSYSGYEHFSWEGYKLSELMKNDNYSNIVTDTKQKKDVGTTATTQKATLPQIPEDNLQNLSNGEWEIHVGQYVYSALSKFGIVKFVDKNHSVFNVVFEETKASVFKFPDALQNNTIVKIDM